MRPTDKKFQFRLTINTKLLLVLLILSVVLLAFSAYTAFNNMTVLGDYVLTKQTDLRDFAVDTAIRSLQKQAEQHLLTIAKDQASMSNIFFGEFESQVNRLVDFAEYLWQNPTVFQQAFPYYTPMDQPEHPEQVIGYNLAAGVSLEQAKPELDLLSYLNRLFLTVQHTNANVYSVYAGTESGITLYAPWYEDDTLEFDPRTRPWYQKAMAEGTLVWTDPYLDSEVDALVMTCARPFHAPDGTVIGVIGIDITLTMLVEGVISTQVGEGGFAFLTKANGGILASPGMSQWDEEQRQGLDDYFKTANLLQSANDALVTTARSMTQGETGVAPIAFEGQDIYLAYAPVPLTQWSLGVVMPLERVIAPALKISDQINAEALKTEQAIQKQRQNVTRTMMTIFVIMVFAVVGLAYALSRRITRPILALHQGVNTVGSGNLEYTIQVETGDELEDLADAFNKMTGDLKRYVHDLEVTTAAKKKFETELEIGRQIQCSLLPQSLPQLEGWEIVGSFEPAREVAGDFYDVFELEDSGLIFFVVADVCDKGVGPAMFATRIQTLLRAFSANYGVVDPGAVDAHLPLMRTNEFVVMNQGETSMFATIFAGVLDPHTGMIRYINGGHNPPYIIGTDLAIRAALKATGPVLGPFPGVKYKVKEETLQPGETLFVFTDGLPEAHGPDGKFYSDERVKEIITQPAASAAELMERVVKSVREHIATAAQFDDITLTVIRRKP